MKADLHFDLPEETHDLELALLAPKLASDVEQVDEQLRAWLKYGHSFANGTQALEACRDLLSDAMDLVRTPHSGL